MCVYKAVSYYPICKNALAIVCSLEKGLRTWLCNCRLAVGVPFLHGLIFRYFLSVSSAVDSEIKVRPCINRKVIPACSCLLYILIRLVFSFCMNTLSKKSVGQLY